MLVACGRVPNSDELDVAAGGLEVDEHGHVATDDSSRHEHPRRVGDRISLFAGRRSVGDDRGCDRGAAVRVSP